MMDTERKIGFAPVFDENSRVLILGSFPSVKSRAVDFYYGHKQNRFWRMLCGYFEETIPDTTEGKRAFLQRNHIALWDMVISCEVHGSADATVKNAVVADLNEVLGFATIERILLNGSLSYELFCKSYANLAVPYEKMPSTSPANPRYQEDVWWRALDAVFRTT